MHDYGKGAALKCALTTFELRSRQTGRTRSMLLAMNDGDVLITTSSKEANRLRALAIAMGLKITVKTTTLPSASRAMELKRGSTGRLHLSHDWFEAFWRQRLEEGSEELEWLAARTHEFPKKAAATAFESP